MREVTTEKKGIKQTVNLNVRIFQEGHYPAPLHGNNALGPPGVGKIDSRLSPKVLIYINRRNIFACGRMHRSKSSSDVPNSPHFKEILKLKVGSK